MDQLTANILADSTKPIFISQGYIKDRKFYLDKESKLFKNLERRCSDTYSAGSIFSCNVSANGKYKDSSVDNYYEKNYFIMLSDYNNDEPLMGKIVLFNHFQSNNSRYINLGFIKAISPYLCIYLDLSSLFVLTKPQSDVFFKSYFKVDQIHYYKYKRVRAKIAKLFNVNTIVNIKKELN